jgi:peptide/nickel transport system substrate-binding protein
MRSKFLPLLALLVFLLTSHSLSKGHAGEGYGDTLVIGDFSKPSPINPISTRGTISALLKNIIFDGLTKEDEHSNVKPNLALSWNSSRNGLHWHFSLREGVRFHDNTELTAEDVKFTLDSILDPKNNSPYLNMLKSIQKVETKGKYGIDLTLRFPNVSLLYYLTVGILPKYLLEGKDIANSEFNYHPVGTGPFKFVSWSEDKIVLMGNEHYFLGRPHVKEIIVKIFPNQDIVWAQLMKKNLDLVFLRSPQNYRIIEKIPDYRVHSSLSTYSHILMLNNDNKLFKNAKVRQALNYAVNKQKIVEKALLGRGRISSGTIYPLSWAYDPSLKPYSYNPKKALKLLNSVGWVDSDGNHILDRNGKEFKFDLLIVKGDNVSWKSALLIQQQLLDLGIMTKVNPLPFPTYENSLLTRKFEATFLSIISDEPDKNYAWWHSSQINGGFNVFSYKNKRVDELLEKGRITLDMEERKEIYHRFQREVYDDPPGVFLFWRDYLIGIHKRFRGVRLSTAGIFYNINELYVPKDEWKYK